MLGIVLARTYTGVPFSAVTVNFCGKNSGVLSMTEDVQDVELVSRFLETKDDVHFETLMARHRPWIFHTCKRFLRSEDHARDATQEVFARCFQKLHTLRGTNLPGWLKAIAVN